MLFRSHSLLFLLYLKRKPFLPTSPQTGFVQGMENLTTFDIDDNQKRVYVLYQKTNSIQNCMKRIHDTLGDDLTKLPILDVQDIIVLNLQRAIELVIDMGSYVIAAISKNWSDFEISRCMTIKLWI